MVNRGLGRGLEEISSRTGRPNLSSFVTEKGMPDSPRLAVLWMIFGSICFGTMNALVKWTSDYADVWMIIMVRSAVIAFAVAAFAVSRDISQGKRSKNDAIEMLGGTPCDDSLLHGSR